LLCVVANISDLWAIERAGFYNGVYHVIGGKLSAIEGIRPDDLNIADLNSRIIKEQPEEIIIAMSADIDGQTTMFFVKDSLNSTSVKITTLSRGMPIGGEFDYLDEGTIMTAFAERKDIVV
jgi:recombination protein RecR